MNICAPTGLDCFGQISPNTQLCLPPCRGLYLDVNVNKDIYPIEGKLEFQPAFKSYLEWKKGNNQIISKVQLNDNHFILGRSYVNVDNIIIQVDLKGLKRHTELHWVHIHFNTPTFDKITRDEKANFVAKMSALGGTMGLLTGFSVISAAEIVFFGAIIAFGSLNLRKI